MARSLRRSWSYQGASVPRGDQTVFWLFLRLVESGCHYFRGDGYAVSHPLSITRWIRVLVSRSMWGSIFLLQQNVTRQNILNCRQFCVSHEGISVIQKFLCETEDRIDSKTTSASKPDAFAQWSSFIPRYGSTGRSFAQHSMTYCVDLWYSHNYWQ